MQMESNESGRDLHEESKPEQTGQHFQMKGKAQPETRQAGQKGDQDRRDIDIG
jgi:hypothetical protein